MRWLYALLIAAAAADVATRALVPAYVPDASPWVNAAGFGVGFLALKAFWLAAVIGGAELIRRTPPALMRRWPDTFTEIAWVSGSAVVVPIIAIIGWTVGAASNVLWLATWH